MSAHKKIDRICILITVFTIIIALIFCGIVYPSLNTSARLPIYENKLFDTSRVHRIDIVIDNWDSFLENCESEEYSICNVVIDGESVKNSAIRAKGNTSLNSVRNMNSSRYSFKIEFDHFDKSSNYHGLDKLCLNNIIQDNTYMKDYLAYTAMKDFGADAPLCSYADIYVNGEEWGLYLAVEAIEDAFLLRNYGSDYGDLYKPDSMGFGGGRGNGKGFNMDDFNNNNSDRKSNTKSDKKDSGSDRKSGFDPENMPQFDMDGGFDPGNMPQFDKDGGFDPGSMPQFDMNGGFDPSNMPQFDKDGAFDPGSMPQFDMDGGFDPGNMPQFDKDGAFDPGSMPQFDKNGGFDPGNMPQFDKDSGFDPQKMFGQNGNKGGFGGMGSSDVKLQYTDDSFDSYPNIFGNAKTTVSDADKKRLINSLKNLSEQKDIESTVNIDEVLRYFVVHNYLCNGDSYTGQMIHNYYLYEKDGQMSMIPWDYNLAFGTFMGTNASSSVNSPIDSPVSGGMSDRPMVSWIFSSEEYTEMYHELFNEFLEQIDLPSQIRATASMIDEYVKNDATKFCTYDEFIKGVDSIYEFCSLRNESIKGQLNGSIPSTSEGQSSDSSSLIDTSSLTVSDMGTMNMGGGKGFGRTDPSSMKEKKENSSDEFDPSSMKGNMPDGFDPSSMKENTPDKFDSSSDNEKNNSKGTINALKSNQNKDNNNSGRREFNMPPGNNPSFNSNPKADSKTILIITAISSVMLLCGILFAWKKHF